MNLILRHVQIMTDLAQLYDDLSEEAANQSQKAKMRKETEEKGSKELRDA